MVIDSFLMFVNQTLVQADAPFAVTFAVGPHMKILAAPLLCQQSTLSTSLRGKVTKQNGTYLLLSR